LEPQPSRRPRYLANPTLPAVTYTMRAIGQDEFEDVKVPDVPVKVASGGAKK
jgi:hypothetical protein